MDGERRRDEREKRKRTERYRPDIAFRTVRLRYNEIFHASLISQATVVRRAVRSTPTCGRLKSAEQINDNDNNAPFTLRLIADSHRPTQLISTVEMTCVGRCKQHSRHDE